jgi:ABC-2 type transport system ATP-binding protein
VPASIRVDNLSKRYGSLLAVDDISFSVEAGETFGVLGPNGAGKTTTLEMIEGLKRPTAGAIFVEGLDAVRHPREVKALIGVQLQASSFFDNLSLVELIDTFAACYGRKADALQLLRDVQLSEKARSKARELSGGQKQRLSIAVGLVNDPKVLFLDEPTTGLDPQARRHLWDLVRMIKSRGKTIVLTTHYMEEAEILCDRVAIMDHAKIIALDTSDHLLQQANINSLLEFTVRSTLPRERFLNLPAVVSLDGADGTYVAATTDAQATLDALFTLQRNATLRLDAVNIRRGTLEDVFLKMTGHQLRE